MDLNNIQFLSNSNNAIQLYVDNNLSYKSLSTNLSINYSYHINSNFNINSSNIRIRPQIDELLSKKIRTVSDYNDGELVIQNTDQLQEKINCLIQVDMDLIRVVQSKVDILLFNLSNDDIFNFFSYTALESSIDKNFIREGMNIYFQEQFYTKQFFYSNANFLFDLEMSSQVIQMNIELLNTLI